MAACCFFVGVELFFFFLFTKIWFVFFRVWRRCIVFYEVIFPTLILLWSTVVYRLRSFGTCYGEVLKNAGCALLMAFFYAAVLVFKTLCSKILAGPAGRELLSNGLMFVMAVWVWCDLCKLCRCTRTASTPASIEEDTVQDLDWSVTTISFQFHIVSPSPIKGLFQWYDYEILWVSSTVHCKSYANHVIASREINRWRFLRDQVQHQLFGGIPPKVGHRMAPVAVLIPFVAIWDQTVRINSMEAFGDLFLRFRGGNLGYLGTGTSVGTGRVFVSTYVANETEATRACPAIFWVKFCSTWKSPTNIWKKFCARLLMQGHGGMTSFDFMSMRLFHSFWCLNISQHYMPNAWHEAKERRDPVSRATGNGNPKELP